MAKKTKTIEIPEDLVLFEDAQGRTISNDPRFHALRTLGAMDSDFDPAAQGISIDESTPEERNAAVADASGATPANTETFVDALPEVNPAPAIVSADEAEDDEDLEGEEDEEDEESEVEDEDEDEGEEPEDYADIRGKELGSLAKQRGVDLTDDEGNKKSPSAVRAELMAQDAEEIEE